VTLIDKAIARAQAEIGQDRFEAGEIAQDYINEMSNYELIEFLSRVQELEDE
jgi:hypothetical protein